MHVLLILVGLKGHFFDSVDDLLLRCGSRHIACFRHGCSHLGGFLDCQGQAGAIEYCNDDDYDDCNCVHHG